jgi:hypothetical protein
MTVPTATSARAATIVPKGAIRKFTTLPLVPEENRGWCQKARCTCSGATQIRFEPLVLRRVSALQPTFEQFAPSRRCARCRCRTSTELSGASADAGICVVLLEPAAPRAAIGPAGRFARLPMAGWLMAFTRPRFIVGRRGGA